MASPELDTLGREVEELKQTVSDLALKVEGIQVLEPRVEALERTSTAHSARLDHMNKVVLAIQLDVQRLGRKLDHMAGEHTAKLDQISNKQDQLLALLQPKVAL
jgi:hypothetical protein